MKVIHFNLQAFWIQFFIFHFSIFIYQELSLTWFDVNHFHDEDSIISCHLVSGIMWAVAMMSIGCMTHQTAPTQTPHPIPEKQNDCRKWIFDFTRRLHYFGPFCEYLEYLFHPNIEILRMPVFFRQFTFITYIYSYTCLYWITLHPTTSLSTFIFSISFYSFWRIGSLCRNRNVSLASSKYLILFVSTMKNN